MLKRLFDVVISAFALLVLSPVFVVIALLIKLESKGDVVFRQKRIGLGGVPFTIHKFRTMSADPRSTGPQITIGDDRRITRVGHILRKYKLDELPQLFDVLIGSMSIVGPRPEVPRYVECYPEDARAVIFTVRPGITDLASIMYRDENEVLGRSENPERAYIDEILPVKIAYYLRYAKDRSFLGDLKIIWLTVYSVFINRGRS